MMVPSDKRLFFLAISLLMGQSLAGRTVLTDSGAVRGVKVPTSLDIDVTAYLGIPYAEPPIGEMRFRKPIPKVPWEDVFDASQKPEPCFQNTTEKFYWMPDTENMTEDCLYLNIWVPNTNSLKLKDVVIWIHGGAFQLGSSDMEIYDGATLAAYGDIIVASMNYRLGFFGFLFTPIEEASGNMGAYDQVLAMEWLKDNIGAFGGDARKITLMGESAGAISISGHLVSPMTKHLFKRVILQSGTGYNPLSFDTNEAQLNLGNRMAKIVGCANDTHNMTTQPRSVVDCLKKLPPAAITSAEGLLKQSNPLTVFPRYGDAYLPEEFTKMIRRGQHKNTEILIGVNEEEGAFFLTASLPDYFGVYGNNGIHRLSKRLAHSLIRAMFNSLRQNKSSEIADFYIKNIENPTTDSLRRGIYQSIGDFTIVCSSLFFADYYSSHRNKMYFFKFTHRPSVALTAEWVRTTHFDEVQYVFGNPLRKDYINYTEDEVVMTKRILDRWLSFIKTGNPNIPGELKWPPYHYHYPVYMDIGTEEKVTLRPDEKRCDFWKSRFRVNLDSPNFLTQRYTYDPSSSNHLQVALRTVLLGLLFIVTVT